MPSTLFSQSALSQRRSFDNSESRQLRAHQLRLHYTNKVIRIVDPNKKGRLVRPLKDILLPPRLQPRGLAKSGQYKGQRLRYVHTLPLPELALNRLHLVFEAQFQLLEPDFFQLFVFAEITFLSECFEAFRVL